MKLVFSEHISDYRNYIFPYAIWAFPEPGESPHVFFNSGFLPSSPNLDRFYLCRQIRVDLSQFQPTSENRRILRKGDGIEMTLVPRSDFDFTKSRRDFCARYADRKFGSQVMSPERLETLFASPLITHVLRFKDTATDTEVGLAVLFCEEPAVAFYYYAFYDLDYSDRNLGMFMMTSAVQLFAERGTQHLHLGTCYSSAALYKTQFNGVEFFNGFRWSSNLGELKQLLKRDVAGACKHALNDEDFVQAFHEGDLTGIARASGFAVQPPEA
jgi:arginyl-tRNA--protein-N-Asp/Glu arginylyltransferase